MDISHEEFHTILKEKDKYDNLRSENENIKLLDWVVLNETFKGKIIEYSMSSEKFFFWRHNIRILKITIDNCHKYNLKTIIDPNNSQ